MQVAIETARRDYDKCDGLEEKADEARGRKTAKGADSNAFLEEDLLWAQARDVGNMTEKKLVATLASLTTVHHDFLFPKWYFLQLLGALSDKVQKA